MSQSRNIGRNATLDQRKARAAGRQKQKSPEREAIRDWQRPVTMKGKTGGAGGMSRSAKADTLSVRRSTKPAKKRGG